MTDIRKNSLLDELFNVTQDQPTTPDLKEAFETGTAFRDAYNAVDKAKEEGGDVGVWKDAIQRVQEAMREGQVSADAARERLAEIVKGAGGKGEAAETALSTANPVNQELADLKAKLAQLEKALEETKAKPSQERTERGGLGASSSIDRILAEVARKQTPDWETLSPVDQEAKIEEAKAGFHAGVQDSKPWEQKLVALQMAGADEETIQRAWHHEQKRERKEAEKRWGEAKSDSTQANLSAFSHTTGIPLFERAHQLWNSIKEPNDRMAEAEKAMGAQDASGSVWDRLRETNDDQDATPKTGVSKTGDAMVGLLSTGAGPNTSEANTLSVLGQILATIKELIIAVKSQGSVSGGGTRTPGPQPDGSFVPGGPAPMAGRSSQSSTPEMDDGRTSMPMLRDEPAPSPGLATVLRRA